MRASVIMPLSPTTTTRSTPKRSRTFLICELKVAESATPPLKTSTATGQPSPLVSSPHSIWGKRLFPSRL